MPAESPKPYLETRPWGDELWITRNSPSMVKIITVHPGEALSLQYHNGRDEYWRIISGDGIAKIEDRDIKLETGVDVFVPRKAKHRVIGGTKDLVFLELAFGDFDEKDIVRLEDKYGRT